VFRGFVRICAICCYYYVFSNCEKGFGDHAVGVPNQMSFVYRCVSVGR